MVDFLLISTRLNKKGTLEIYPKFIIKRSKDLMIRGGDFYAIWLESRGLWSTVDQDAIDLIDHELDQYVKDNKAVLQHDYKVLHLWDSETGMIDIWRKYCKYQMRDNFHPLDEVLVFSNSEIKKEDYASHRLTYPLTPGTTNAWDRLVTTFYSEMERQKVEWVIGSIVTGGSKTLQKFMVLYGDTGTGKGTVINVISQLFDGYWVGFDAKNLGNANSQFSLEPFRNNPLVAIDSDSKLDKIEDNTRLNALVSHETMLVNEKHKTQYNAAFKCILILGTNHPVKITDSKSGLIRRLIDVTTTGVKIKKTEYDRLMRQIPFELGAIACKCRDIYLDDPNKYDNYIPTRMIGATNDFYNYVLENYYLFKNEDGVSCQNAWALYKQYNEEMDVRFPYSMRIFREELKAYFWNFEERHISDNGDRIRSYYSGFRTEKFKIEGEEENVSHDRAEVTESWLKLEPISSLLDDILADDPAQYASKYEKPRMIWAKVTTTLKDLDTSRLHFVNVQNEHHIFADFDLKDETGEKSLELNLKEASKWPPTYAETSKSGKGIHLHYIYEGNVNDLQRLYAPNIEIKLLTGDAPLRRKLTLCNNIPIATINSGLPLKEKKDPKMFNKARFVSEKRLRTQIEDNLNKNVHSDTHQSVQFIKKILDEAYASGKPYDVLDLRKKVLTFAGNSTNNAKDCLKLVNKMHFKSEEARENTEVVAKVPTVFFDCEVFPNLFVICYKAAGKGNPVIWLVNPSRNEIEKLISYRLIGFNCRKYDNHIIYAAYLGYTNEQLYNLSRNIIAGKKDVFFGDAYNLSYTDIYDFSSEKKSLKKFEIDLKIHHQELRLPWDQPVPEKLWDEVVEYCKNDVIATEAVFDSPARQADFSARKILAEAADMTVNDTTNSLTTRIIFGKDKDPQSKFNYRDLGAIPDGESVITDRYSVFSTVTNKPVFIGYKYEAGVSTYRGEVVGEGGYVYAEPGIYYNVAVLDIASMHPSSIIAENLFGPYTERLKELLDMRLAIKHGDFEKAKSMFSGKFAKYLDDPKKAKGLSGSLKIVINAVYGQTAASFDNPFRDKRNIDNIVAKRGALFMLDLKYAVQDQGYQVVHIKTDSIKIPNATPKIIEFVMNFGKRYGYTFEHESTYNKICLVNDAVFVARYASKEFCEDRYGYIPEKNDAHPYEWTATGTQFQVPYVFKSLFTHEPIEFYDLCETKSVNSALYLRSKWTEEEKEEIPEFIGRVGLFCPIKPGCGGKELLRESKDKDGNIKYSAVTGTKGYEWLESETVKILGKEKDIDISYYQELVEKAEASISKYGDIGAFLSDLDYSTLDYPPDDDDLPF